eukprot:122611-Rhodomonas_salina.5
MLRGLGYEQVAPATVREDNATCIMMANNPVNQKFERHIDTRRYYVRDLVRYDVVVLLKCTGTHNVADALTKSLPGPAWSTRLTSCALASRCLRRWLLRQREGGLRRLSVWTAVHPLSRGGVLASNPLALGSRVRPRGRHGVHCCVHCGDPLRGRANSSNPSVTRQLPDTLISYVAGIGQRCAVPRIGCTTPTTS